MGIYQTRVDETTLQVNDLGCSVFTQDHICISDGRYFAIFDGHCLNCREGFVNRVYDAIVQDLVNLGFVGTGMKSQEENDWDKELSTFHSFRGNVIAKPKI